MDGGFIIGPACTLSESRSPIVAHGPRAAADTGAGVAPARRLVLANGTRDRTLRHGGWLRGSPSPRAFGLARQGSV